VSFHRWEGVQRELLTEEEIAASGRRAQQFLARLNAYRLAETAAGTNRPGFETMIMAASVACLRAVSCEGATAEVGT
jgi:hypothetical protein